MLNEKNYISDMENEIREITDKFYNKRISEIKDALNISRKNNKASYVSLSKKMLNSSSNKISLPSGKEGILKTVRFSGNEKPYESMSFMPINFEEWIEKDNFKESEIYKYFNENIFIFFIFQQYTMEKMNDSSNVFKGIKVWKMTDYDLHHGLLEVWAEVRRLILDNELVLEEVKQKSGKIINKNNLPGLKFNYLGHLRPGGIDGNDKILLPTGQKIVRQRFWLNKDYVNEIIKE